MACLHSLIISGSLYTCITVSTNKRDGAYQPGLREWLKGQEKKKAKPEQQECVSLIALGCAWSQRERECNIRNWGTPGKRKGARNKEERQLPNAGISVTYDFLDAMCNMYNVIYITNDQAAWF